MIAPMEDGVSAPVSKAADLSPVLSRCYSSRTMKANFLSSSSFLTVTQDRPHDDVASPTSHAELLGASSPHLSQTEKYIEDRKGRTIESNLATSFEAEGKAPEEHLRSLIKSFMDEASAQWSVNEWAMKIASELGMGDTVSKEFKKDIKAIVMDELSALASQLSQGAFTQEIMDAPVDASVCSGNITIDSESVRDVVFRLFNAESMLWSVKTWMVSVCKELGIAEASPELKRIIKDIVTDAAKDAMTQSQDMDYTLEVLNDLLPSDGALGETEIPLDFAEDEASGSAPEERDADSSEIGDDHSQDAGSGVGEDESDSFSAILSSEEDVPGSARSNARENKKNKKRKSNTYKSKRAPISPEGPVVPKLVENLEEKKLAVANEEVQAAKALEEGLNERALAVFELTYRDKDEIESKHNELRNKVMNRIRKEVNPQINQAQAQMIGSLKALRPTLIDKGSKLMQIVKVLADDAALKTAETMLTKADGSSDDESKSGVGDDSVVELSDEDDEDDERGPEVEEKVETAKDPAPEKKSIDIIAAGALRVGQVKTVTGIRARLKAELRSRALEESCSRLAEKKGLSSSEELTAVLGYTEVIRRTHAAQQAEQERLRREQEEKERLEKEQRRRKYREKLFAQDEASSDFEFDEVDDDFNKPVAPSTKADKMELTEESDADASESEDEKDEEEKLAELEMREKELEERLLREAAEEEAAAATAAANAVSEDMKAGEAESSTQIYGDDDVNEADEDTDVKARRTRKLIGDDDEIEGVDDDHSSRPFPPTDTQPTQIVDDSLLLEDEDAVKEAEARPSPVKPADAKPKSKNAKYQEILLRDVMKSKKQSSNMFLDVEAEEEEEEGLQRGLLDFGFGKTSDKIDAEEEADALKLRKADLEGIVDEVSDDEGDEEEGRRRRMEEERKHDRKLQLKILKTLAEGHGAARAAGKAGTRGHFGLDELTTGDLKRLGKSEEDGEESEGEGEERGEVVEIDDEADLQYIDSFKKRVKEAEEARANQVDSDLEADEDESGSDDEVEAEDPETAAIEREERRLRKEREAILTRTWLETTRMKCVMHEEDRKQKLMSGLMSLGSDINGTGAAQSQNAGMPVNFPKGTGHVLSQSSGNQNVSNLSRAKSMSALISTPSLPSKPLLARQPSAHLLQELENIGNPAPAPTKESVVTAAAANAATSTEVTATKPPVLSDITNISRASMEVSIGFGSSSLALNAVTHFPAVVKKSMKRSMTASRALPEGPRLTIDTSMLAPDPEASNGISIAPPVSGTSSGSSTLMGPPTKTPRTAKNGYSGILDGSAGEAALCMGMALAPDSSNADSSAGDVFSAVLSKSGLASKPGFNAIGSAGRKMSFFPAAASAVNSSGMKRSLSSAAVTVAGQGFVFTSESRLAASNTNSQLGDDHNSSTGFGDDYGQTMGLSNANSNFYSESNAPSMKRQKSTGSLSSMSGPNTSASNSLVDAVKRQMSSALNHAQQRDDGRKAVRSILDTIHASGTSSRSTSFKRSATVTK